METPISDIEAILDKIRQNSSRLSNYHRKRYVKLKSRLKYYRIPIIVISALNSVGAVSLQGFVSQTYISLINMFLSLLVGIIGSIEMFYQISNQMVSEVAGSTDFYILSCDIFKYLALDKKNRTTESNIFLNESYTRYIKLIETSITLKKRLEDNLQDELTMRILALTQRTDGNHSLLGTSTNNSSDVFSDSSSEESNIIV